jgi:hypothetical protein
LDGAAFADNLRHGLAVDPRCGGRGRDQGRNYARLDPNAGGLYQIRVEQGPAYRPETPAEIKGVWTIRVRAQLEKRSRDLSLFNLAIDGKLRGCNLVRLRVDNVCVGSSTGAP